MIKTCPDPVDVQDIQFKLQCKLKIFNNKDADSFSTPHNLASCASRYGLFFIGNVTTNLQVIQVTCLENYSPKDKEVSSYPRRHVTLPSAPRHISVNCDSTILAVVVDKEKCPAVIFYDVLSFLKDNISVIKEVRLSANPAVHCTEINWNPSLPSIFTACKSDGTLGVYEIKDNSVDINELPSAAEATTFCWSPKGKQIAVGSKSGKITQYKPDLKAVKVINAPPLEGVQYLISLQWVSNYQFLGIYQPSDRDSSAKLIVIDAPKTGDPTFTDYEDVCYSGTGRVPQFYMNLQPQWNLLMLASSNSTEVAVLGLNPPDTWVQWIISDSARALSLDRQETFPIGMAFDTSNTKPYPWGESTIPPCPYLLILSHQGVLSIFNVINLKNATTLCSPPEALKDTSGLKCFVTEEPGDSLKSKTAVSQSEQPKLLPQIRHIEPNKHPIFMAPQATVPSPSFNFPQSTVSSTPTSKPTQPQEAASQNIFGGQITITPIKPQTTVKPLDKPQAKEKYSAIFSALNTTATIPTPAPVPVAVQAKSIPPIVSEPIKVVPPDTNVQVKSHTHEPSGRSNIEEHLLSQMIKEECISLDSELKAMLHKGRTITVNIGHEEEKLDMIQWIRSLDDFLKEIVDISLGENAEVHTLKQNLILSWAWYEEALSYYNAIRDDKMNLVLKSRPLDTLNDKRSTEIKKLIYYIESQLLQVGKELDEQWDNFQTHIKKIHRMQMPTMETIFQTMVRQSAVLQRQEYIMKDIRIRLKHKVPLHGPMLVIPKEHQNTLYDALKRLDLGSDDNRQKVLENINNQSKQLTKTKTKKLRNLLKDHKVAHITAIKPQLSQISPLSKQMVEAKLSPMAKSSGKKLTFAKSIPAKDQQFSIIHVDPFKQSRTESSDLKPTTPPSSKTTSMFSNLPSAFAQTGSTLFSSKIEKSNNSTAASITPNTLQRPISTGQVSMQQNTLFKSTPFNFGNKPTVSTSKSSEIVAKEPVSSGATSKTVFVRVDSKNSNIQSPTATTTFSFISSSNKPTFTSSGNLASNTTSSIFSTTPSVSQSAVNIAPRVVPSMTLDKKPTAISISNTEQSKPIFGSNTFSVTSASFGSTSSETASASPVSSAPSTFFGSKSNVVEGSAAKTTSSSSLTMGTSNTKPAIVTTTSATSLSITPSATSIFSNITATTKPFETSTTQSSIFKSTSPVASQQGSIFGGQSAQEQDLGTSTTSTAAISITTSQTSLFGSNTSTGTKPSGTTFSIFGSSNSNAPTFTFNPNSSNVVPLVTQPSIFATSKTTESVCGASAVTLSTSSIFAKPADLDTTTTSTSKNIFGSNVVSSIFGTGATDTTATIIGTNTTNSTSIFGASPSVTTMANSSIFESKTPITTSSIFGSNSATTPSIFGSSSETSKSGFGSSSITTTPSVFGSSSSITTPSVFGSNSPTTTPSVFGSSAAATTQSGFGSSSAKITASVFESKSGSTPSVFGASSATTTASVFGTSSATTSPSVFGTSPATTSNIIFGGNSTTSSNIFGAGAVTTSSIFGTNTTVTTSIFGTTGPVTTNSIFATPSPATTASIFGSNTSTSIFKTGSNAGTATSSATNIFGAGTLVTTPSAFGTNTSTTAMSMFGSNTPTSSNTFKPDSSGSIFGSPSTGSTGESAFNFGNLNVGNTTTTATSNIFGSNTSTVNPFDRTSEQKSTFGGGSMFGTPPTTSSIFGTTPSSTTSSIFGSNQTSTFGGTNTQQPAFGNSSFGSNTNSTFGQSSTFGQGSFGNTFSSSQQGPFSGGTGVAQTGFGSPPSFQKQSGFGAAPVFGTSPTAAFGGNPSFGASPAFGAAPSFGSPSKVFGSTTPATTFGSPGTTSSGFGNLANQNTIGFGNLAQQAATSSAAPFSGNSSFSNWR